MKGGISVKINLNLIYERKEKVQILSCYSFPNEIVLSFESYPSCEYQRFTGRNSTGQVSEKLNFLVEFVHIVRDANVSSIDESKNEENPNPNPIFTLSNKFNFVVAC